MKMEVISSPMMDSMNNQIWPTQGVGTTSKEPRLQHETKPVYTHKAMQGQASIELSKYESKLM